MASRELTPRFIRTWTIWSGSARTVQRARAVRTCNSMSSPISRCNIFADSATASFKSSATGASTCLRLKASICAGEIGGASGGVHDGLGVAARGVVRREAILDDFGVAADDHEEVVEVVGDASCEASDGLHFLRVAELLFELLDLLFGLLAAGDVLNDPGQPDGLAGVVADEISPDREPSDGPAGGADAELGAEAVVGLFQLPADCEEVLAIRGKDAGQHGFGGEDFVGGQADDVAGHGVAGESAGCQVATPDAELGGVECGAQLLAAGVELEFGLLAAGDVDDGADGADRMAGGILAFKESLGTNEDPADALGWRMRCSRCRSPLPAGSRLRCRAATSGSRSSGRMRASTCIGRSRADVLQTVDGAEGLGAVGAGRSRGHV